ncbi:MAG: hypothetical protein ACI89L_000351 [Phycisphaerales bacterium]|jgi:hypothetical protein
MTIAGRLTPETVGLIEPILESMLAEHEVLLALAIEHRGALSKADPKRLDSIIARTGESMARIAGLEDDRCRVLGVEPGASRRGMSKPTITEIAALAGGDDGARLHRLGERLRELIERVRAEHATVQAASRSLADHMRGVMKQVAAKLSHAGTYSAAGTVDPGRNQVMSGIDIKS